MVLTILARHIFECALQVLALVRRIMSNVIYLKEHGNLFEIGAQLTEERQIESIK